MNKLIVIGSRIRKLSQLQRRHIMLDICQVVSDKLRKTVRLRLWRPLNSQFDSTIHRAVSREVVG